MGAIYRDNAVSFLRFVLAVSFAVVSCRFFQSKKKPRPFGRGKVAGGLFCYFLVYKCDDDIVEFVHHTALRLTL